MPEPVEGRAVTFARGRCSASETNQGRDSWSFGGEVLKAKQLEGEFEERRSSCYSCRSIRTKGRYWTANNHKDGFFAIQPDFLRPSDDRSRESKMTIVGEVSGAKTDHLDDVEYRYPIVIVKHLHTWQEQSQEYLHPRPGFSFRNIWRRQEIWRRIAG